MKREDEKKVTGMVLNAMPVGEYNKRLILITRELGKITVFAGGATKPTSPFLGASFPFSFGDFYISRGKNAYNLHAVSIKRRFEELSADIEKMCRGSYFLELADYYAHEGMEGEELLKLLYLSLSALINENIPDRLVTAVFELRCMVTEGEYTEEPPVRASGACSLAWHKVVTAPLGKLYTFVLSEEVLREFEGNVSLLRKRFVGKKFKSRDILKELQKK
ncbi:MAG: DNA repair protein RecO [Candidatus Avilachnospira sp.]|jgi:DNA repair protein RecO (recombination protein O)